MEKIASIGAHALDAELMGGPYLIREARDNGAEISFVHMTRGERGNKNKSPEEYGKQLEVEMVNVAEKMGGKSYWMEYVAGQLPDASQMIDDFEKLIEKEGYDTIITHWRGSLHDRHILCHDVVTAAVKRLWAKGKKISLYYGENCEDLNGFIPELYIQFDQDVMDTWIDGLNEYELFRGGVLTVPYLDYYTTMAKMRGIELGILPYARAFMVAPHKVAKL